jgi:hypothetical protein
VRLSASDRIATLMARRGDDESHMHIGVLMWLESPIPALAQLRQQVSESLERAPVLGYRLNERRRRWEPVVGFDPSRHVQERVLKPGTDVLAAADAVMRRPFSRGQPLWGLTLLHGHGGSAVLCYRVHHMFQDGVAVASVLEALFGARRLAPPSVRPARTERVRTAERGRHRNPVDLALPLRRRVTWSPLTRPLTGHRILYVVELDSAHAAHPAAP